MKTPEQLAAETAKMIVRDGLSVRGKNYMASHWPDSINALTDCARDYILVALTEHAKGLEEKAHGFKLCFPYETIGNMNPALFKDGGYHYYVPEADLTALRAVADEMEAALKDFEGMMSESIGIAGYHLNGDVFGWDEGDDPLRDKTCSALTRYADLKKENN